MDPLSGPIIVDFSRTIGQLFLGTVLGAAFWGITCLQMVYYLRKYDDKWYFRAYVIVLWMLGTAYEIICVRVAWKLLIPIYGNPLAVPAIISSWIPPQSCFVYLVAMLAQSFFIWRIWRFSNSVIFPIILVPLMLWGFAGGIVIASKDTHAPAAELLNPNTKKFALGIGITNTVLDVSNALIMTVLLRRRRSDFRTSQKLILRLMYMSMTTGAFTAIFALLSTIPLAWPDDSYYFMGIIPSCAVYCNAVLANLNSRNHFKITTGPRPAFTSTEGGNVSVELEALPSTIGESTGKTTENND